MPFSLPVLQSDLHRGTRGASDWRIGRVKGAGGVLPCGALQALPVHASLHAHGVRGEHQDRQWRRLHRDRGAGQWHASCVTVGETLRAKHRALGDTKSTGRHFVAPVETLKWKRQRVCFSFAWALAQLVSSLSPTWRTRTVCGGGGRGEVNEKGFYFFYLADGLLL